MPSLAPFTPGTTVSLAVTSATGRVALPTQAGDQIVVNAPAANSLAFIEFGDSTVEAAVTDYPILPGTVQTLTVPRGVTYVAAITATSTATLYFTRGDGE